MIDIIMKDCKNPFWTVLGEKISSFTLYLLPVRKTLGFTLLKRNQIFPSSFSIHYPKKNGQLFGITAVHIKT